MKAIWNDKVVAEAEKSDVIYIEGNWYFPPDSIRKEFFTPSDLRTTCFWKGEASYYDITVDGKVNDGAAWYYPAPKDGSIERVKKDFSSYVAFWRGVQVEE
ncbi:DUF427 domain-containing protein [Candidatus Saccharibacteria bacterium]|nr:DUF427 domain-containing protein [Candidatus Saccharibacteria bacterium]